MVLKVEAIKFNYDPYSNDKDAINIRKNASEFIEVPEWKHGQTRANESVAVYSIKDTLGKSITIKVKITCTNPQLFEAEIRAVHLTSSNFGEVKARRVVFSPNGSTDFEIFQIESPQLWDRGVGSYFVEWLWQYRETPSQPWTDFEKTYHKIYTILEVSNSPWQQTPYDTANTQLPWADALNYACEWVAGAHTLDDVAGRITQQIYSYGESTPPLLEYDCPGGGSSNYSYPKFNCTAFLELLRGGIGNGPYINCSDCATIVSTFANLLGCILWQCRMGGDYFPINPILAIGTKTWNRACGLGGFSYHEVAWKGQCTSSDELFDACLQVDGDHAPESIPHAPLLPVDIKFDIPDERENSYLYKLVPPSGYSKCKPVSATRVCRPIF